MGTMVDPPRADDSFNGQQSNEVNNQHIPFPFGSDNVRKVDNSEIFFDDLFTGNPELHFHDDVERQKMLSVGQNYLVKPTTGKTTKRKRKKESNKAPVVEKNANKKPANRKPGAKKKLERKTSSSSSTKSKAKTRTPTSKTKSDAKDSKSNGQQSKARPTKKRKRTPQKPDIKQIDPRNEIDVFDYNPLGADADILSAGFAQLESILRMKPIPNHEVLNGHTESNTATLPFMRTLYNPNGHFEETYLPNNRQLLPIHNPKKKESRPIEEKGDNETSTSKLHDTAHRERQSLLKKRREKWSKDEMKTLWTAILECGNNWTEISKRVLTRNYFQIKDKGRRELCMRGWETGRKKSEGEEAKRQAQFIAKCELEKF